MSVRLERNNNNSTSFASRVHTALKEPPIDTKLYDKGWTREYAIRISKVNAVCKDNEICDHGIIHSLNVARNAFFFTDLVRHQVENGNPRFERSDQWSSLLADPKILFVALTHDLGYGDEDITVRNRSVTDHAGRSARAVTVFENGDATTRAKESGQMISRMSGLLQKAISSDIDHALDTTRELQKQGSLLKPEEIFPIIPKVADGLDYFRNGRVADLEPPNDYRDNPYHFIANAVDTYYLSRSNDTVFFNVRLQQDEIPQGKFDFQTWLRESRGIHDREYGKIWELAEAFTGLLGMKYKVVELR